MSINAVFVQVEEAEIARFEADPDLVETLFTDEAPPTAGLLNLTAAMEERLRTVGPQAMAATLSRLPDPLRQQLEASLGRTAAALESGVDMVKLMQDTCLAAQSRPPATVKCYHWKRPGTACTTS